jgi:amino acid adenylation domain-containing protein
LQLTVSYSSGQYREETIHTFADNLLAELGGLIRHCISAESFGRTPSDFPLTTLSQAEVDRIAAHDRNVDDIYPATAMQHGMLFHSLYSDDQNAYLSQVIWKLDGDLDVDAFAHAWRTVVNRHTSLRTGIHSNDDGEPLQIAYRSVEIDLQAADWQKLSRQQQEQQFETFLEADRAAGFELNQPPLMRLNLFRISKAEFHFVWSYHHTVIDGWSIPVVVGELLEIYLAKVENRQPQLNLARSYRDYVEWLHRQDHGKASEFWGGMLAGLSAPTELPAARIAYNPTAGQGEYAKEFFALSETMTKTLQEFARSHRLTMNTLAQGVWSLLLSRYSGNEQVIFGATTSGRPAELANVESIVGLLINSLPIATTVDESAKVCDWLGQLQEQQLSARQYEYASLVEIQGWSAIPRGTPLFNTLLVFENYPEISTNILENPAIPAITYLQPVEWTHYPLTVAVMAGSQFVLRLDYDQQYYDTETIAQIGGHFIALLEGIIADANRPVAEIPMLLDAEREQLLVGWNATTVDWNATAVDWNATAVDYPQDATLQSLLEAQAAATPDAEALVFSDESFAETSLSYAELNARTNQLAHLLIEHGSEPDDLVGVCMERSVEMVVALLGIIKAGLAYVPLDPDYPEQRLEHMLEDADLKVLLTQSAVQAALPNHSVPMLVLDEAGDELAKQSTDNPPSRATTDNLAYVIFTSGSTGRPKGVMNEHRGIVNRLLWMQDEYGLTGDDRVLQKTPFSFDVSVWEFFWPLISGATLVVAKPGGHKDPGYLAEIINQEKISTLHFVPSMLQVFLADEAATDCTSLTRVICSGEALSHDLQSRFYKLYSHAIGLHNLYGPTEAAIDVTYWACPRESNASVVPIGRPVANTSIYIVDKAGNPTPVGVPGELWIGGTQVARGYVNRPELTGERFISDPFSDVADSRVYKTGDLVRYRADGVIEFLGRIDHQVKLRGFRIELGEIEAGLDALPQVEQSLVLLREDVPGDKRLVAYVSGANNTAPDVPALRQALAAELPDYMVPSAFVVLNAFPLLPNGKVNRKALPEPEWHGDKEYLPPRTPTEQTIAEIWTEVLNVQEIGIHDDFFELGGHSLIATRLVARVNATLNIRLELRQLFENPTIESLAIQLDQASGTRSVLAPIVPTPREPAPALSFAQQRLWFIYQLDPDSAGYNVPGAFTVTGKLDRAVLQDAVDELVERHESLRTTFLQDTSEPVQIISADTQVVIQWEDFAQSDTETVRTRVAEMSMEPFDLSAGPLLRVHALQTEQDEHVLFLMTHHIVSDAWSNSILMHDFSALYNARVTGREAGLPPLEIQYADYAAWQRNYLDGGETERQLEYWRNALDGAPSVLSLPTDRQRPALMTANGATAGRSLPADVSERLRRLARAENSSLFMLLLAAFNLLLSRYASEDDIVVGAPIAGRQRQELENQIGFFVNSLVMRTDLSGNPTFTELLARVREAALGAYEHQDLPFEKLVEELQPARDTSHTPLFQVTFVLQNPPEKWEPFDNLQTNNFEYAYETAKFDLSLSIAELPDGLYANLNYNTDLFDAVTIDRMLQHFATLLDAISTNPQHHVVDLPLLQQAEEQQLVDGWRGEERDFSRETCIHQLFEAQVARNPDAVAVSFENQTLTYGELNARANRLAHRLIQQGVQPDTLVGLCVERSLDMVTGVLGILKAGGAYLPLDPHYPVDRLAYMASDSKAAVIVLHNETRDVLPAHDAQIINIDVVDSAELSAENITTEVQSDNLAYVIYTSGSTGKPKGVLIQHNNVARLMAATEQWFGFDKTDVWTLFHSYAFDFTVWELWGSLLYGGKLVIVPYLVSRSPQDFHALLAVEKVTVLNQTPSAFAELMRIDATAGAPQLDDLRWVIFGGEALDPQTLRPWFERYGDEKPTLVNMYGITETTVHVTFRRMSLADCDLPGSTIGVPIPDLSIYILDTELKPVPTGVPGEMYVGGAGLARGYLNRPELTEDRFINHPFSATPGARLYRTGDRARFTTSGELEYLGRVDHQIKLRGFRIELGEIEAAVNSYADVEQSVVILREDSPGNKQLVAYFVGSPDGSADIDQLRQHIKAQLPDYMVPAAFVSLESMPLTPSGKVSRQKLPEPEWTAEVSYVAPRTDAEQQLCDLWAETLGIDQVGIHDDFFTLGGHSLLAMQLASRIRDTLHTELPLASLFNYPTVAELAGQLGSPTAIDELMPADRSQPVAMSFAQQRMWFLDVMEPGSSTYNVPWVMQLDGPLDIPALQSALDDLVARHESLRTTFADNDEAGPLQIIRQSMQVPVESIDASGFSEQELRTRVNELTEAPFDLEAGPLLRLAVLNVAPNNHVLALTVHHIICDAWSLSVLYSELAVLYQGHCTGTPSELPALAIQYADYTAWQNNRLSDTELDRQVDYWRGQLADAPPLLNLPLDKTRPAVEKHNGATAEIALDEKLLASLEELARDNGCTLFNVMLAAFDVLLRRYAGEDDIVVGTPISGRQRSELENIIGFFLNTLAIRTDVGGNPTFIELISRVRQTILDAFEHQDLPFEKLVEELQPTRNLSHAPIFQVLFVLNPPSQPLAGLGDIEVSDFEHDFTGAKFDLQLTLSGSADSMSAGMLYNTDLFEADTIRRMLNHFALLLAEIVDNPATRIDEFALLGASEREHILADFNATAAEYPAASILDLVAMQVARTPDKTAMQTSGHAISYAELNTRANRLAHSLLSQGAGKSKLVAICAERGPDVPVAILAVLKTGSAYVPIDPSYPPERIAFMLEDSHAPLLITQTSLLDSLPEHPAATVCLDEFDWAAGDNTDPAVMIAGDDPVYAIYTSGSTGQPKGVLLAHAGLANLLQWQQTQPGLNDAARTLQFASFSFDVSFQEIFSTWQQGGALLMIEDEMRRDLPALARFIAAEGIERLYLPFAALQPLIECIIAADLCPQLALRDVIVAGEQLQITPAVRELFTALPDAQLHNQYGPSETHVVTSYTLSGPPDKWQPLPPIGTPVANCRVYVLDREQNPLPIGVPGELYVGGVQVALGYLHRDLLTAEKFVADPFDANSSKNGRLYRTGDRVRFLADGNLEYLGRTDEQVKWRGFRIEPGEIEALLASHTDVQLAAVLLREDSPGDKRLIAYLAPEIGKELDIDAIRAWLKNQLPDYMVPSAFMAVAAMPLTPSGKIARRALPTPDSSRVLGSDAELPKTEAEQAVAYIWQRLLKIDQIALDDNFFDLGGHSLLTVKLTQQIEKITGEQLTIADVFENPTVREFSQLLANADWGQLQIVRDNMFSRLWKKITRGRAAL